MKVKEFLYLLPRQPIWKYELEFSGFTDKEEAEIASIIPKVVEDFFCFIRKQTFY